MKCCCEDCGTTFDADPKDGHRLACGDATDKSVIAAFAIIRWRQIETDRKAVRSDGKVFSR